MGRSLEVRASGHGGPTRRGVLSSGGAAVASVMLGYGWGRLGAAFAQEVPNGVEPAPGMPPPRFVETNGIRMGYYELGEGPAVIFCHGFPELAYSWRYQLPVVAEAGYRTIAPDQRGYGLTDRPREILAYTLEELCADMAGLLDALEIEKAVFVGHDWGGGVVWMMPRYHPDRVLGVVGINTPASHPEHPRTDEDSLIVRSDRYYTVTFQPPGEAEAVLSRDVQKTFELILRRGGLWDVDRFRQLPEDSLERRMDLLGMLERGSFTGELLLAPEEMAYFVETFEATGFTGGLNWYRAAARGPRPPADLAWDIEVPCLYIGAENDVILRPSSADGMEAYISDFERYTVEDCGHWTQQEKPDEVNQVLTDWLRRKIRAARRG